MNKKDMNKLMKNSEYTLISTSNGTGIEGVSKNVILGFVNLIDNFKECSCEEEIKALKDAIDFAFLSIEEKEKEILKQIKEKLEGVTKC